nr:PREDICTED: MANSC domain-containing protein 1 [Anolis carolinensis]XP_016849410.1 PREDICTED: MANSC domain-containing protein 1 [Anolis carolinensis]|eukprot:XP_008109574.1 PREDICTED: MANSC domain-containing protein 1 [Anolis carolinensis]
MSFWIAKCFAYALAVVVCVMLKESQSQVCSTEKMENITFNIKMAFSKGIQGKEPIFTSSAEACINICCLGGKIGGNKVCNYVVFNTKRKGNYPNCYLFYYPTKDIFPARQVLGLVTYRIIHEIPKPAPSTSIVFQPTVNGHFMSAEIAMLNPHSTTNPSRDSDHLQKPIASNRMETLDYSDRIDGRPQPKEDVRNVSAITTPNKISNLLPPSIVKPVQHSAPIIEAPVKLLVVTTISQTGIDAAVSSHVSAGHTATARSATAYDRNTLLVNPGSPSVFHPSAASGSSASKINHLPFSLPTKHSSSLQSIHLNNEQENKDYDKPDEGPGKKHALFSGDQSILLAALLLGVILLLLVTVLVGRKMLESLQQRQYTRLDYLINGMYASM